MTERKSLKDLDRLTRGDDVLGGMSSPAGAPPEDAVELWARRVGRGLAILATVGLIGWVLFEAAGGPK